MNAATISIAQTQEQLNRCFAIRLAVFVGEQHVPLQEEVDALDTASGTIHLLASCDGRDLGTLRILPEGPGHCHIGRVAVQVAARGSGVGRQLMARAAEIGRERCCDSDGHVKIMLLSQEQAMGFYEACGYAVVSGERYLDAGIWHQDMVLDL